MKPRVPGALSRTALAAGLVTTVVVVGGATQTRDRSAPLLPEVNLAALNAQGIYVAISGYPAGESTSAKHPNVAVASAVTSGVVTTTTSTTSGKATPSSVVITKPVDNYTPLLAKAVTTGAHLSTVTIWFTMSSGSGERDIARLTLTNVVVKSATLRFSPGGTSEVVTLLVRREALTYWPQKADGSLGLPVTWCWDFYSNVTC